MDIDPQYRPMGVAVKYNPHLWSDDELRDIFVVRQEQLQELIDRIRSTSSDITPQATLLVGARGMGKTTLLRRLAVAIRENPDLDKLWLPLTFPEEQYTVSTLAEFWRNVLDSLIDALEHSGETHPEVAELDRRVREISDAAITDQASQALSVITEWCETHQRRLILLIDSTDLLLESLRNTASPSTNKRKSPTKSTPKKGDDTALWQLRKTLLQTRCLMWVGATFEARRRDCERHDGRSGHRRRPSAVRPRPRPRSTATMRCPLMVSTSESLASTPTIMSTLGVPVRSNSRDLSVRNSARSRLRSADGTSPCARTDFLSSPSTRCVASRPRSA